MSTTGGSSFTNSATTGSVVGGTTGEYVWGATTGEYYYNGGHHKNGLVGDNDFTLGVVLAWCAVIVFIGVCVWRVKYWRGDTFVDRAKSFSGFPVPEPAPSRSSVTERRYVRLNNL